MPTRVYAATASELNFQSRIANANGSSTPDGNYHVEFKLYNVATGGTAEWTETYTTGSLVRVVNGYMSVRLGSVAAFPGTIDWSQEHWLTMNIGGSAGTAVWDGEMNPRIKLTAVPLAFRALQADRLTNGSSSLTSDDLLQKAPLSLQSVNAAIAGLRFNQTGAGGLVQLQTDGADTFTIARNGSIFTSGNLNVAGGGATLGTTTQAGSLTFNDGNGGQTGVISTTNLSANRTYTLPDADGTVCLTTTCAGAANSFINGGNSFGGLATLGTNDNNGLAFETFGTTKLTILAGGNVGIGNTSASALLTVGATEQFQVSSTGAVTTTGVSSSGALSVTSGGASLNGGLNNNSGGITNSGSITGVGANITGSAGLTIASGGSGDLTLDSASNVLILTDPTLRRTASGATTIDLVDTSATSLVLSNSSTGVADLNLADGSLVVGGTQVLSNTRALSNVTASTDILTSGILGVTRGGTGAGSFTSNGVIFGNGTGTLQVTTSGTSGQLLLANATGVPGFVTLSGDATVSDTGVFSISANSVALGTDTTGNYLSSIGALVGLTDNTVAGEGAALSLSVNYGSTSTSAVRGDTTLTCASGTGNLGGGGNAITLGSGGTCNAITITDSPTFTTSVTSPIFTGAGAVTISSGGSGDLTFNSASNKLVIDASDTSLQRTASGSFTFDLNNGADTTLVISNSGAGLAGLSIEGGITAGNGNFNVSSTGDVTAGFVALNGTSTANGNSGLTPPSTALTLTDATNFDVGNYVQMNSANCGGTGINPCYAKITSKAGNVLTIAPALTWASGATVNEYHIPEIGGSNTSQPLTGRYGRGYFISGVATGNGTTFFNEDSITSSLTKFDLLNTGVTTLNIGGSATDLTIGAASTTINIAGTVNVGGTARVGSDGTLQNVSANNSNGVNFDANTITSGVLGVGRGGSGASSFTTNGIIFGNAADALQVTAAGTVGQLLLANASGVPGFVSLSGDATISASGLLTIGADSVTLGTDTVGNYIGSIGSLTGLTDSTVAGEGSALSLSINYGSTSTSAVRGDRTIICPTGTGNLSGGGNIITLGNGGTCGSLNLAPTPVFTTLTSNSLTSEGSLSFSSAASGDINFDSSSNKLVIAGSDTVLQRSAAGGLTIDLTDTGATSLILNNSAAGTAGLDLNDGGLATAGTVRLTNAGALQNITSLSASGAVSFGSLSSGGLIKANGSGALSVAVGGTDYEVPLTISNGLTRTGNNVSLGGALTANSNVALAGFDMAFSGTGNVLIGTTTAAGKFTIEDSTNTDSVYVNKTSATGNLLSLKKNGSGVFTIFNGGATQINTDSAAALQIRNAAGTTNYFTVNSSGNIVQVGSSTGDATGVVFVLDSKSGADPTGGQAVAGAQYYNSTSDKFRCFEGGAWKNCISETDMSKAADEAVTNSAALQNDDHLFFAMAANTTYVVNAVINYSGDSTADLRYSFTAPAGASVYLSADVAINGTTGRLNCNIIASGQVCSVNLAAANRGTINVTGYVTTGATAGNLQFQFAQNTAALVQPVTVYKGSILTYRRTSP